MKQREEVKGLFYLLKSLHSAIVILGIEDATSTQ